MLIIDPDAMVVEKANKTAIAQLGEALVGNPLQVMPVNGSFILAAGSNGKKSHIDFKSSRVHIHRKVYLLAIGQPVARQAALRLQLQHLEKERNLQEMKANFISMTSHEFRTPLTAIASAIDLVEGRMQREGAIDDFYRRNIAKISHEVFNLNTMLDEILTLSKIVSNNYEINKMPVDVRKMVDFLKHQYFTDRRDDRKLEVKISGTPRKVIVDKDQLSKILVNLIGNAFKYSDKKNPVLRLRYHKRKCEIRVADHGIGIPEKDIPNLFNSFYRGSNVDGREGTGLGLSIVKTFVEMNGGKITVDSEENKGTTFSITFRYEDE
ncbi:sensor histidine kinase [Chitinophaga alhagiae]|uniref:sensor histidine kinase n=1 Tax=Chitinophaga alhagiae TaxID=2203219 RepID=UPI0018E59BBA|nr:HAMP domain-containing sensor histidine kinase [Chitinophaga alhagiae]